MDDTNYYVALLVAFTKHRILNYKIIFCPPMVAQPSIILQFCQTLKQIMPVN